MARSKGSLSYFKKRTSYLNTTYGLDLSPTRLARIYKKTGTLPPGIRYIIDLDDIRDYKKHPEKISAERMASYDRAAFESNQITFAQLGSANNFVKSVLDAERYGGYINRERTYVYRQVNGTWEMRGMREKDWRPAKYPPQNAEKLTPKLTREIIAAKAKEIKEKKDNNPGGHYAEI